MFLSSYKWALYRGEIRVSVVLKGALYRGLAVYPYRAIIWSCNLEKASKYVKLSEFSYETNRFKIKHPLIEWEQFFWGKVKFKICNFLKKTWSWRTYRFSLNNSQIFFEKLRGFPWTISTFSWKKLQISLLSKFQVFFQQWKPLVAHFERTLKVEQCFYELVSEILSRQKYGFYKNIQVDARSEGAPDLVQKKKVEKSRAVVWFIIR